MAEILIVEDDEDLRFVAVKMLKMAGHVVHQTSTRDEAIEIINAHSEIDTVLLDITMPGMSLKEFITIIKCKIANMKIIFSSGQNEDIVENLLEENETFEFLAKPYGLTELQSIINQ